jgi:hypothetical protein
VKSIRSSACALILLSFSAGCGIESSLVDGRCKDGLELSGGKCVAPGGITSVTPTDPPSEMFGNLPPSETTESVPSALGPVIAPSELFPTTVDEPPQLITEPPIAPPELLPTELVCSAPLVACRGACIAVVSDGANCGACGKICPSNICIDGECVGATPGDVVLIGHDYASAFAGSAQAKVLVNAMTIPTTDPIRILSFEDGAPVDTVDNTRYLAASGIYGRKVQFTRAPSASALESDTLGRSYDIVLIHEASAVDPVVTGESWAGSLGRFTEKGGVVVALDRGTSPIPLLLSSSGLLQVSGHTALPIGTHLTVASASDVVGAQVLSPYAAFGAPVSFQGLPAQSADLTWVVRATNGVGTSGDAVVVHRIVRGAP